MNRPPKRRACGKAGQRAALLLAWAIAFSGCGEAGVDAYQKGISLLHTEDYAAASEAFSQAVAEGREAEGSRGLGIAALAMGRPTDAAQYFEAALAADRSPQLNEAFRADTSLYLAAAYTATGETEQALSLYQSLLTGPRGWEAYTERGALLADLDRFQRAEADFKKAAELHPEADLYLHIYQIYAAHNRLSDGAAFLKQVLAQQESRPKDALTLGRLYAALSDWDNAASQLAQAAEAGQSDAILPLGQVYLKQGKTDEAKALFSRALEAPETARIGRNGLALAALQEGDAAAALAEVRRGLALEGDAATQELLFNEVVCLERQRGYAEALAKLEDYVRQYPQDARAARERTFLRHRVG